MSDLKRRWLLLKAAFGPKPRSNVANAAGLQVGHAWARAIVDGMR